MLAEIGLSDLLKEYSPTRHLASAIFPFSDTHKYMAMLTVYMDETGHSRDQKQRFNGMAGLMAPTRYWERLEQKWKATLKLFRIPYFHMKDFANFAGCFEGWSERQRRKLYDKLLTHIEAAYPWPIGSILAMEDYRSLSEQDRAIWIDPYHIGFNSVIASSTSTIKSLPVAKGEKVALVFSDQVEFRGEALRFYEIAAGNIADIGNFTDSPVFRDMRVLVPLQAADIVAYELYKEYERRQFRPTSQPRHAYHILSKMARRHGFAEPMFIFHAKEDLQLAGRVERRKKKEQERRVAASRLLTGG